MKKEQLILEDLKKGLTKKEIQTKHNVSKSWLYTFSKKHGFIKRKPSEEFKEKVIWEYTLGETINSLSDKYNIPKSTLGQWFKLSGVSRGRRKIHQDTKSEIIERYKKGEDSIELSSAYDISPNTITSWLRELDLTRHRGPQSKIINEEYFDEINTEKKSYFLGLIMADGNTSIYNGQYSLKIALEETDGYLIDEFLSEIKSTNKTYFYELALQNNLVGRYKRVSLSSKHMVERLIELGVVPRKTGIETFPSNEIPTELQPHFWRGYFDGDGGIYSIHKMNFNTGSIELMNSFLVYFGFDRKIHFNNNSYTVYLKKEQIKTFYEKCYKESNISMLRKKEVFEKSFANGPYS